MFLLHARVSRQPDADRDSGWPVVVAKPGEAGECSLFVSQLDRAKQEKKILIMFVIAYGFLSPGAFVRTAV